MCEQVKNRIEAPAGKLKLKLNEVPRVLWVYLMVDFITKLPLIAGKSANLVVYDRLSKIIYFMTTTESTSAERLARLFRDNMWKLYRLLEIIVSDRRPQFVAVN